MTASMLGGTVLATALLTASPASAAAPVPSGCTFDRGLLTCVRSGDPVTVTGQTTNGYQAADYTVDGFTGTQICQAAGLVHVNLGAYSLTGGVFTVVPVTTTTQRGASGRTPVLTSTVVQTLAHVSATSLICLPRTTAG